MFNETDFSHKSTYFLVHELQVSGFQVEKVFPHTKKSHVKIFKDNEIIGVMVGQRLPSLTYGAYFVCKNKQLTKECLQKSHIRTPQGKIFSINHINQITQYVHDLKSPSVVIKPTDGTWGKGVCLDVRSQEDIRNALQTIQDVGQRTRFIDAQYCLVEEQIQGKEYRFLATKDRLLSVIHRIPANVVGDGTQTIEQLIHSKNADSRRGNSHEKSLVKIIIDDDVREYLRQQNVDLQDVPSNNQVIYLRKMSNLSMGGDSIDCTDIVHQHFFDLAPKIIRAINGLPYAGIDIIVSDITSDPLVTGYAVIEINDSPMISMHHEPYQGRGRNVAKEIIALL